MTVLHNIFNYVFMQLLTYVIHLYVSINFTSIITMVLTLQLLTYVRLLYMYPLIIMFIYVSVNCFNYM